MLAVNNTSTGRMRQDPELARSRSGHVFKESLQRPKHKRSTRIACLGATDACPTCQFIDALSGLVGKLIWVAMEGAAKQPGFG